MTMLADLDVARQYHGALTQLFGRYEGDRSDHRALRRVLALCEDAAQALDDDYCRQKLRLVSDYTAELLSASGHAKWGRDTHSGAEFLRQQVLNALELYASRLYSLEALRRAGKTEDSPWKTRSSFAPI
jgi:hypothetical protein